MTWKNYMTYWIRKLLTQLISIKVWLMAAATILVIKNIITPATYTTIVTTVIAIKGAYTVAGVVRDKITVEKGE